MKKTEMPSKSSALDSLIRYISPTGALKREQARMALSIIEKSRRFDGSSKTSRFSQWKRPSTSADSAISMNLPLLRNGSRDLTRNNPWAERAITVIEGNTIGTGIQAQFKHTNAKKRKKVQTLWDSWANSIFIDSDERLDLVAMENLIMRTIVESGEVLIRRRAMRLGDNLPVPLQIQILEPDHLDVSKDGSLPNGVEIKNGIEFNKKNKRVAYWLLEEHPGASRSYRASYNSVRVPASEIIHAFDTKRAGQTRGYPWVASAIRRLKDFDDYEDAQLVRQKIAACFTGFIHDMNASAGGATGLASTGPDSSQLEHLQPGVFEHLPPGKDIKFPTPPSVQNYNEYTINILRGAAAAYGITYEAMSGDYSNVNFSSGRMGWIEMSRNVNRWQKSIMCVQVLTQIERWFLGAAELSGVDVKGVSAKWQLPRREMIDPAKEIPATIKGIRAGITSLTRVHASLGIDSEEIFEEIEESNKILDNKNIILDSDPRNINLSGSENGKTEAKTDDSA